MGQSISVDKNSSELEVVTSILNQTENTFKNSMKQIIDVQVKQQTNINNRQEINISDSTIKDTTIKQQSLVQISQSIANEMMSFYQDLSKFNSQNESKNIIIDELKKSMQTQSEIFTTSVSYSENDQVMKQKVDNINKTCNQVISELEQQFNTYIESNINMNMDQIINIQNSIIENVDILQNQGVDTTQESKQKASSEIIQEQQTDTKNEQEQKTDTKKEINTETKSSSKGLIIMYIVILVICVITVFIYFKMKSQKVNIKMV